MTPALGVNEIRRRTPARTLEEGRLGPLDLGGNEDARMPVARPGDARLGLDLEGRAARHVRIPGRGEDGDVVVEPHKDAFVGDEALGLLRPDGAIERLDVLCLPGQPLRRARCRRPVREGDVCVASALQI
jgi:hypothetical protein